MTEDSSTGREEGGGDILFKKIINKTSWQENLFNY